MWQAAPGTRKRKPKANTIRLSGAFAGNEEEWTREREMGRRVAEGQAEPRGVARAGPRKGGGGLVMLAAGQAAYKIHKISALKSAAGQKLKT